MIVLTILGWLFSALILLLLVSMVMLKNWLPAIVLLFLLIIVMPLSSVLIQKKINSNFYPLIKGITIVLFLFLFSRLLLAGLEVDSIYADPQIKDQFESIYKEKMAQWPVPYESIYLETEYGRIHVIRSGEKNKPPLLLLHASGVASWSWKFNIEELAKEYEVFAIDTIGDAGRSEYKDLKKIMLNGEDQALLYSGISDQLGIDRAYVVGASEGGFIASNYALYKPERIKKVALLGPMGYSGASKSIIRITFAQLFPLKTIQQNTFRWAFNGNPQIEKEFGDWFILLMSKTTPKKVAPFPLSARQRQSIKVPVLFIFGTKDNLVGDPKAAGEVVRDMADVKVEILDTGHLVGGEKPKESNRLILDFFKDENSREE